MGTNESNPNWMSGNLLIWGDTICSYKYLVPQFIAYASTKEAEPCLTQEILDGPVRFTDPVMKWLFNARTVAISFVVAIATTIPSTVAHAQVTVNTNWVQTATTGPSPRGGPSMTYDPTHRKTLR